MKIWATTHKNHKIIKSETAESFKTDRETAFLDCLEQVYRAMDLAEPLWLTKHYKDIAAFHHVKFMPEDFMEPVNFDWFEVEILDATV